MLLAALDLLEAEKKILEEDGPSGGLDARRRSLRHASLATLLLCPVIGSLSLATVPTNPRYQRDAPRPTDRPTDRQTDRQTDVSFELRR